jgi:predicted acylesterase/phospholipase RssA
VAVAISGGGSRAAVFSAAALFRLEQWGLLDAVDVVSSVSGGSFTAAYYAASCDEGEACVPTQAGATRPRWTPEDVYGHLESNYLGKWVRYWFYPWFALPGLFTYYDRSDIMAEVIDNTLFDRPLDLKRGLRFEDLNPRRPNLIVNATNYTGEFEDEGSVHFTFTREDFETRLKSDIRRYPLAKAIMASAAFPGAFHFVTLEDFRDDGETRYVHLFDAGTSDNLGLNSVEETLRRIGEKDPAIRTSPKLVLLIDAHAASKGKDPTDPDPRTLTDRLIDSNFLDAYNTLMYSLRGEQIETMRVLLGEKAAAPGEQERRAAAMRSGAADGRGPERGFGAGRPLSNGKLLHLSFDVLQGEPDTASEKLRRVVTGIPTSLKISPYHAACLKEVAAVVVDRQVCDLLRSPWYAAAASSLPLASELAESCKQPEPQEFACLSGPPPIQYHFPDYPLDKP